jgi:hypothetical protein
LWDIIEKKLLAKNVHSIDTRWALFSQLFMVFLDKRGFLKKYTLHKWSKQLIKPSKASKKRFSKVLKKEGNLKTFFKRLHFQTKGTIKSIYDKEGKLLQDENCIANYANKYLITVMNAEYSEEALIEHNHPKNYKEFKMFSVEDIQKKLLSLADKGPQDGGINFLNAEMLAVAANTSAIILYSLFVQSYQQSKLPEDWRHTLIDLRHKDGDIKRIENYRPIGKVCAASKVIYLYKILFYLN